MVYIYLYLSHAIHSTPGPVQHNATLTYHGLRRRLKDLFGRFFEATMSLPTRHGVPPNAVLWREQAAPRVSDRTLAAFPGPTMFLAHRMVGVRPATTRHGVVRTV